MAWWDKSKTAEKEKPKIEIPEPWECAREITKDEADRKDRLPLGWYFWKDGYVWYAMRPNPETGELERSFYKKEPQELEEWLGMPVRKAATVKQDLGRKIQNSQGPDFLERMGLADPAPVVVDQPPTDTENSWAEEIIRQELQEPAAPKEEKPRKKRKTLGRTHQVKIRLTDAEMVQFQRRVKKSGLAQGDYLRSAALTGQIVVQERSPADIALLDELAAIRAELGRQGGLLKMVIKPNEGQRELAPDEWAALIQAVRDMEKMKSCLSDLEVKMANGNSDPQNEQKRTLQ